MHFDTGPLGEHGGFLDSIPQSRGQVVEHDRGMQKLFNPLQFLFANIFNADLHLKVAEGQLDGVALQV